MRLSPTEQRLYDTLKDGQSHSKEKLKKMLYTDNSGTGQLLIVYMCYLRKKLAHIMPGHTIICERVGHDFYYRLGRVSPMTEE